jgi:hypothetical protein
MVSRINSCTLGVMKRGALAMIDALGFKGIWRKPGQGELVLKKLSTLVETTETRMRTRAWDIVNTWFGVDVSFPQAIFLSDTIVVTAPFSEDRSATPSAAALEESMCVRNTILFVSTLMGEALDTEPYLLPGLRYRRRICRGEEFHCRPSGRRGGRARETCTGRICKASAATA